MIKLFNEFSNYTQIHEVTPSRGPSRSEIDYINQNINADKLKYFNISGNAIIFRCISANVPEKYPRDKCNTILSYFDRDDWVISLFMLDHTVMFKYRFETIQDFCEFINDDVILDPLIKESLNYIDISDKKIPLPRPLSESDVKYIIDNINSDIVKYVRFFRPNMPDKNYFDDYGIKLSKITSNIFILKRVKHIIKYGEEYCNHILFYIDNDDWAICIFRTDFGSNKFDAKYKFETIRDFCDFINNINFLSE